MKLVLKKSNTENSHPEVFFATNNEYIFDNLLKTLGMERYCNDYVDFEEFTNGKEMEECVGAIYTFDGAIKYSKKCVDIINGKIDSGFYKELKYDAFSMKKEIEEHIKTYEDLKKEYEYVGFRVIFADNDYKESDLENTFEVDFSNSFSKDNYMGLFKEWYQTNSYIVEEIV